MIYVVVIHRYVGAAEITTVEGIFAAVESGLQLMQADRQVSYAGLCCVHALAAVG